MVVDGCYSPPSLGHLVWLGEVGEALVEYEVEEISHRYTPNETVNPVTGLARASVDGVTIIKVSEA